MLERCLYPSLPTSRENHTSGHSQCRRCYKRYKATNDPSRLEDIVRNLHQLKIQLRIPKPICSTNPRSRGSPFQLHHSSNRCPLQFHLDPPSAARRSDYDYLKDQNEDNQIEGHHALRAYLAESLRSLVPEVRPSASPCLEGACSGLSGTLGVNGTRECRREDGRKKADRGEYRRDNIEKMKFRTGLCRM